MTNKKIVAHIIQLNFLRMLDLVLNSQIMTPNTRKKLKFIKKQMLPSIDVDEHDSDTIEEIEFMSDYYSKHAHVFSSSTNKLQEIVVKIRNHGNIVDTGNQVQRLIQAIHASALRISEYAVSIFLHGSMATGDFTDFSDVDACIIIKDKIMRNPRLLLKLKKDVLKALKVILKFDNLQHHGFFFIPEGFLKYYPQDFLPVDVYKNALLIEGARKLELRVYKDNKYALESFFNLSVNFTEHQLHPPKNLYEIKHLLSQFMLLPTLFLQTQGVYVYKKYSFDMVRSKFTENWWPMDEISQIRKEWTRPKSILFNAALRAVSNPWYASLLCRKTNWSIPTGLSNRLRPELLDGMIKLSRRMQSSIQSA